MHFSLQPDNTAAGNFAAFYLAGKFARALGKGIDNF